MRSDKGVRLIALLEAAKGLLVFLAGFGLLSMVHRDVQQLAENLVGHFHINPASRYPRIFLALAGNISDTQLWLVAGLAFSYTGIRLAEAYGLWLERRWAKWLAVLSGAIYLPIELYELLHKASWIKACTLTVNVGIVIYMCYVLKKEYRR